MVGVLHASVGGLRARAGGMSARAEGMNATAEGINARAAERGAQLRMDVLVSGSRNAAVVKARSGGRRFRLRGGCRGACT